MLTSICRNCGASKNPTDYANNYCILCDANMKEHIEHAIKAGTDVNEARRVGLAERAHTSRSSTPDPRAYIPRVDSAAFEARVNIEPGSPGDPRLGGR
jgi:hypothetical protein